MTIQLGWWLLPLLVSIVAFIFAEYRTRKDNDQLLCMAGVFYYPTAVALSLLVWLIWSLV